MWKTLMFRWRYRAFFRSPSGARDLAEQCLGTLTQRLARDMRQLKEAIGRRLTRLREIAEERQHCGDVLSSLGAPGNALAPPFPAEKQEALKRAVVLNSRVVLFITLVESILNYVSMVILVPNEGPSWEVIRGILALAVTVGSIFVFDRLFVEWRRTGGRATVNVILWGVVAAMTLFALFGISSARAADFEAGLGKVIYYGFVTFSLVLPVLGGWYWAERELSIPEFRRLARWEETIAKLRGLETEGARLKGQIRDDLRRLAERFTELVSGYWETVNFFRTLKSGDDAKQGGPAEDVNGTSAENFDRFCQAARVRYHDTLRTILGDLIDDLAKGAAGPVSPGAGSAGKEKSDVALVPVEAVGEDSSLPSERVEDER